MNPSTQHSIQDQVAVLQGVSPQSTGAATVNGTAVDRLLHNLPLSCVVHQSVGAITGSPSATSVTTKIQHSPDSSTWTDFDGAGSTVAVTPALSAANTDNSIGVDLGSAMRYIRAVIIVAFTGGSSPAALVGADLVIAGESRQAAT